MNIQNNPSDIYLKVDIKITANSLWLTQLHCWVVDFTQCQKVLQTGLSFELWSQIDTKRFLESCKIPFASSIVNLLYALTQWLISLAEGLVV